MKHILQLWRLNHIVWAFLLISMPCQMSGQTNDCPQRVSYWTIEEWTDPPLLSFQSRLPFNSYSRVIVWEDGRIAWEVSRPRKEFTSGDGSVPHVFFHEQFSYKSKVSKKAVEDVVTELKKSLNSTPFRRHTATPTLLCALLISAPEANITFLSKEHYFDNTWPLSVLERFEEFKDQFDQANNSNIVEVMDRYEKSLRGVWKVLVSYKNSYGKNSLQTDKNTDQQSEMSPFVRQFVHEIEWFLLFRKLVTGLVSVDSEVAPIETKWVKRWCPLPTDIQRTKSTVDAPKPEN